MDSNQSKTQESADVRVVVVVVVSLFVTQARTKKK